MWVPLSLNAHDQLAIVPSGSSPTAVNVTSSGVGPDVALAVSDTVGRSLSGPMIRCLRLHAGSASDAADAASISSRTGRARSARGRGMAGSVPDVGADGAVRGQAREGHGPSAELGLRQPLVDLEVRTLPVQLDGVGVAAEHARREREPRRRQELSLGAAVQVDAGLPADDLDRDQPAEMVVQELDRGLR